MAGEKLPHQNDLINCPECGHDLDLPPPAAIKLGRQAMTDTLPVDHDSRGTTKPGKFNGSDLEVVEILFSRAGKKLYFEHIPETKGVHLKVTDAADISPDTD